MVRPSLAFAVILLSVPATAAAHITLVYPPPRISEQKVGPCGTATSVRGSNVTVLEPGATIEVRWTEPINHPSHYRISFDLDGQDFTVPADFRDLSQTENVLVDDIADANGGSYTQMVTLPATPCETCTLQLIQMMYDKPPYGDGNDIYFQCADIALRTGGGPGPDGGGNPGTGSDAGVDPGGDADSISGGCAAGRSDSGTLAFVLALGAAGCYRRRRARA